MIPASGEFTYATQAIRKTDGGATVPENLNALADSTDMVEALDRLQAMAPAVESVSLVVAWFGDDLRAGSCKVRPGVEVSAKSTTPASWSVNGVTRRDASRKHLCSRTCQDICHGRKGMIDPTPNEAEAMTVGGQQGGEYLESIGKSDLATLSETEWDRFIDAVVTGYCDHLRALAAKDRSRLDAMAPEVPF